MILETKRLLLRPAQEKDAKGLAEGLNNKGMNKFVLGIPYPYTEENAKQYIKYASKTHENKEIFFIELKKEKKIIGVIDIHAIDKKQRTASTGSWIGKNYQGNKYITEAKIAINDYVFNKLNIRKLWTNILVNNIASIKTQEKVGYRREGILRQHYIAKDAQEASDAIAFGLLKNEWEEKREELLNEINALE
jgi:RimJ/RimL family protein N-acetyltransferase